MHNDGQMDMDLDMPSIKTIHGYGGRKSFDKKTQDNTYCFVSDAHRNNYGLRHNPFVYNGLDASEYMFSAEKDGYFLFLSRIDLDVKGLDQALVSGPLLITTHNGAMTEMSNTANDLRKVI